MATIQDYFDTDLSRCLWKGKSWHMRGKDGKELPQVTARIYLDFDANAKYWAFFIPAECDVYAYANAIVKATETRNCVLGPEGEHIEVYLGFSGYPENMQATTMVFTNRIFLYIDTLLDEAGRKRISDLCTKSGFCVVIRDREYAQKRSETEKPLAFVSHDSRDKEDLVRDLVRELSILMCPVWYDEYSLKVGASLRQSIESGIKETKNCIVVLSPNFLANDGWGRAEFDSVYTREILEKNNVILPIWHNVSLEQVYSYCPRLADKVGLPSSLGAKELARKLAREIKQENIVTPLNMRLNADGPEPID